MRKLACALAAAAVCALSAPTVSSAASVETVEAQMTAASAASIARQDMFDAFGEDQNRYSDGRANSVNPGVPNVTDRSKRGIRSGRRAYQEE